MMDEPIQKKDGGLPLGLLKQASLKLNAFMSDIHEILQDPDLTDSDRQDLDTMREMSAQMEARLLNIVRRECSEEDFLAEVVAMDEIGTWPGDEKDIGEMADE